MAVIPELTVVNFEMIMFSVVVILVSLLLGNVLYHLLRNSLDDRLSKRFSKVVSRFVEYVFVAVLLYIGLVIFLQINFSSFTASLGIMGVIVAFSSTQIIQNTLAGFLILLQRPIRVEDWIELGGATETSVSKVRDISLMRTTLRTRDGRVIFIPNSILLTSRITNYTKSGFVEIAIPFVVPRETDINKVKMIILDAVKNEKRILPLVPRTEQAKVKKLFLLSSIKEFFGPDFNMNFFLPRIIITDVSNQKVTFSVRVWIREIDQKEFIVSDILSTVCAQARLNGLVL